MNETISRRKFLSRSAVLSMSAAAVMTKECEAQEYEIGFPRDFAPQEKCFMDQYYEGFIEIVRGIRDTQIGNIAEAVEKAYELKRKGGRICSHVNYGHYAMFAGSRDRPGQPWVLPQCRSEEEELNALKKGDFLITNHLSPGIREARERGVYVVGITNSYVRFYKTPPDGLVPRLMETTLEDVCNLVIDSQVPWDNGLVSAPQIPQFKLCPSTGMANFLVYWACTASLATLIGTKGRGSSAEPAEHYLDTAYNRVLMIGTDRSKIDRVAEKWADLVLGKQYPLLLYGHDQDVSPYVGTRNMFVCDATVCASGSFIADMYGRKEAIPHYGLNVHDVNEKGIVLICGLTSDNTDEINVARNAREVGSFTVAFCPYGTDGDTSGIHLFKEVDIAFNTYCDESAGVISVMGFDEKVSPLSGICGNLIHWMLMARWTDHMARRGEMPYYWQGYHENGGREYDEAMLPIAQERGY